MIEFSHSRHVEKTGLIKNLIITEESGIAKGIRRVIAVTGVEAQEVTRTAVMLEAELAAIARKSGKEKDSAMKVFSTVSLWDHDELWCHNAMWYITTC